MVRQKSRHYQGPDQWSGQLPNAGLLDDQPQPMANYKDAWGRRDSFAYKDVPNLAKLLLFQLEKNANIRTGQVVMRGVGAIITIRDMQERYARASNAQMRRMLKLLKDLGYLRATKHGRLGDEYHLTIPAVDIADMPGMSANRAGNEREYHEREYEDSRSSVSANRAGNEREYEDSRSSVSAIRAGNEREYEDSRSSVSAIRHAFSPSFLPGSPRGSSNKVAGERGKGYEVAAWRASGAPALQNEVERLYRGGKSVEEIYAMGLSFGGEEGTVTLRALRHIVSRIPRKERER